MTWLLQKVSDSGIERELPPAKANRMRSRVNTVSTAAIENNRLNLKDREYSPTVPAQSDGEGTKPADVPGTTWIIKK